MLPLTFKRIVYKHRDASVYKDSEKALTNQWTLVSVQLPVGEADRIQRINKARSVTDTLKTSLLPVSTMLVNTWLTTCLPHCFMQRATFQAYNRHSCVFSSIPGPQVGTSYTWQCEEMGQLTCFFSVCCLLWRFPDFSTPSALPQLPPSD